MFEYSAFVEKVVDGDTIDCRIDLGFKIFTKQRIRLNGIDTPERGHPGFTEASEFVSGLILGKYVQLKTTKISKWGYMLGDVYFDDIHVNAELLKQGYAVPYSGGTKITQVTN